MKTVGIKTRQQVGAAFMALAALTYQFASGPVAHAAEASSSSRSPAQLKASVDASGDAWDLVGAQPGHSNGWQKRQQAKDEAAIAWENGDPNAAALLDAAFNPDSKHAHKVKDSGGPVTPAMCPPDQPSCTGGGTPPASASIESNQAAQTTSYYCGPAAVHEALGSIGVASTQSGLAGSLKTTTDGTAWYGIYVDTSPSTGWPIEDVLNNRTGTTFYNSISVDYTPTATQKSSFQSRLKADIYSGWPLIGNAYEVPGGPHLVGHPTSKTIYHYFEIRGYSSSGGTTMYEDSVHNASSISWSASVPAYSSLASDTIATIVGGRGYVW